MNFTLSDIKEQVKRQQDKQNVPLERVNEVLQQYSHKLKEEGLEPINKAIKDALLLFLAEDKLKRHNQGLIFFGSVGTGKTIAMKIISSIKNIRYYTAPELLILYTSNQDHFWGIINDTKDIIIDDLAAEEKLCHYGMSFELMNQVIFKRHTMFESYPYSRSFFTTNLSPEAIMNRYSERIYSRLVQMCKGVNSVGQDLRRRNY